MIELPSLYEHQEFAKDALRKSLARHRRSILCATMGFGKTRVAKVILGTSANRQASDSQSGFSLFAVHRRGLVSNASKSFSESPTLDHGLIMSGHLPQWKKRTQVASIDTLMAWFIEEDKYSLEYTFDLIVYDEAHTHHSVFARFLKRHDQKRAELGLPPAYVAGLTATPDADGLSDVYGEIVYGPTREWLDSMGYEGSSTQWLIDNGYHAPYRYFRATNGDFSKLKLQKDRYTDKSVAAAMAGLEGDLVRDWKRLADGRVTLGFFSSRPNAKAAMEELRKAGIKAGYVDGYTEDSEREDLYQALNEHDIDYLCNVQVVERGTDIPRIECIQMCVAVAKKQSWLQRTGRGSRMHPKKKDCIVLDHGGNLKRGLGFIEDDHQWVLDQRTKKDSEVNPRPTIECPNCQAIYRGGACSSCGYEPTKKERGSQGLTFDGSELVEVTKSKSEKEKAAKSPESLMIEAIYKAGRSGRTWRQAVGIYNTLNKQQGTSHRVPKTVTVGGHTYKMLEYTSIDSGRRVKALYPFVEGSHGGKYLQGE